MYKIKELIDKGLDINSLPEDIKKDIEYIKITTNDFETDYSVAREMDEIVAERIETEILNPKQKEAENPFIGDAFFKKNPGNVLGEQTTGGRFGDSVIVKGDSDAFKNIDIPVMPKRVFEGIGLDIPLDKEPSKDKIKKVFEKTAEAVEKDKNNKIIRVITQEESQNPEVMSFREVVEKYNPNISREELEAFLYSRPDLPHLKYIDNFQYEQTELAHNGYLLWHNGRLEYCHIFLSGDVHKKRTETVRDKDIIIEQFGEDFYEAQLKAIDEAMPSFIRISEGKEGINILPHSEFSKTFKLKREDYMFNKAAYFGGDTVSLYDAFLAYLSYVNRHNPGLFSGSNHAHLRDYATGKKIKARRGSGKSDVDKKLQEKEEKYAWQKAKEIADRLYLKMIFEEITLEGKSLIEKVWNERYNTYRLPDYSKIPVGFTLSKYFVNKELELNVMQRESVGFMSYIKSGINAGGVGLGKSLSAIACMSQSVENGKSTYPLLIVPNNVYEKWIRDIEGYRDDANDKMLIGALHHFPKMRKLYNMSPDVVYNIKKYTTEERKAIEDLKENFELVRQQKKEILDNKKIPDSIFNISDNPYAAIAIDAMKSAEERVNAKVDKHKKEWNSFMAGSASYTPEYIQKRMKDMEGIIKDETDKLPIEFSRIYYDLVKDEYIHLIYSTGVFEKPEPGTITIITHDAIKGNYLGVRDSEMLIKRMYEILSQGDRFDDPREATKLYEKITERVESVVGSSKIFIEDLNIDYLVIDEAHAFKKIFTSLKGEVKTDREGETVQREVTKGNETSKFAEREYNYYDLDYGQPSGMALSGYFLTQYIQLTNNGANTLLLTATPFENSPLEIYGMLSMANHAQLEAYGFKGIKEFFDTFMKIEYDYKVKINGVERDTVLNGFVNLPQLRTIVRNVIMHRTGEQIEGLIRPDKIVLPLYNSDLFEDVHEIKTMLVPSDEQKDLIRKIEAYINGDISLSEIQYQEAEKDLIEEMIKEEEELIDEQFSDSGESENIKQAKKKLIIETKFQTEAEEEGTRIIQGINYIKQITCSPYLLKLKRDIGGAMPTAKEFVETSPKLSYIMECIKSVKKYHEDKNTPVSGQIIYMTWGKMFFPLIKEYLTDPKNGIGFAKDEVEIISGDQSKNKKEELKKAFNDNKIKVLIASKSIQVGADLQAHTSVLYHVFYDWNPTDNEQINGRAWRQGNKHLAVRIVYPMVENSVDPVIFQYLEEKTLRIKDVWDLATIKSQLDLSEFDPRRLKIDAITDPNKKARLAIAVEKEKLSEELSYYRNILEPIRNVPYIINQFKESLEEIPAIHQRFFNAELTYKSGLLIKEFDEKIFPVETELGNVREPITKLEAEIHDIENEFDQNISVLNESISNLDSELQSELAKIKSQITDAVMEEKDDLVKTLRKQYNELPNVYKTQKQKEIENKISKLEKQKVEATKKQKSEIEKLNVKIGEKIEKLNAKLTELNERHTKKGNELKEYYQEKINKTVDEALFESREKYYTFLYSTCTEIIKFIDVHSEESGYYDDEFEQIKNKSYDIKYACSSFKQYRDEYYRAIKLYLEPMSIKEEDALQVVQVYQGKINDIIEKINSVEELYEELYQKFDVEYQERMASAKTPKECAQDFAKLNFLLDHVRIEAIAAEAEPEEILPEEIEIEVPESEEQAAEKKPAVQETTTDVKEVDEKFITLKIKLFQKVLKVETDEKAKKFIGLKLKIFERVLKSISLEQQAASEGGIIKEYAQGGIIEVTKTKKLTSYIDLVDEGLMSKKDFVQYMRSRGNKLLPSNIFEQIKECSNYDLIIDILKMNNLV